ncbi:MAG: hypothetical protein RR998_05675 [Oscillospiraceae bacterium]
MTRGRGGGGAVIRVRGDGGDAERVGMAVIRVRGDAGKIIQDK